MSLHLLAVLSLVTAQPSGTDSVAEVAHHVRTLQQARVPTDGPALLKYLQTRTLSEKDREKLSVTVAKLGARSFRVREQALRTLIEAGRNAVPDLEKALRNPDPEIRLRARRALETIRSVPHESLMAAVARVLAARRPAGAAAALLAYLPSATDQVMEEAFLESLAVLTLKKDKIDPVMQAALKDKNPARRAAAAYVHGRATPPQIKPLKALLTDADAKVRYLAAEAVLRGHDKASVPVLIGLLGDGPLELAWQVEDLLCRVAGEKSPPTTLGTGDAASRTATGKAWQTWWKANSGTIKLANINFAETLRGLTVIVEMDGSGARRNTGRVWECGRDGKLRWNSDSPSRPSDAHILPNGNFVVAEHGATRVTERDRNGKILWTFHSGNSPVSCQRLPNGNIFLATYYEVMEVTKANRVVYRHRRPHMIFSAQKLRNGRIVYAHSGSGVIEMDAVSGKVIHSIPINGTSGWAGVEKLRNGRYLVARYSASRVTEIDVTGKVYWDVSVSTPGYATRLPNGNTLACSIGSNFVVEFNRAGKEVWRLRTQGRPFRVHRR